MGRLQTDDAPNIPGEFGVDHDPYTAEDGRGDNQDQPLPEPDEYERDDD